MDLRKAKTDKKDAVRIARYALEKSYSLVPYTSMEQKYEDLKFLARQYNQRMLTLKPTKYFYLIYWINDAWHNQHSASNDQNARNQSFRSLYQSF